MRVVIAIEVNHRIDRLDWEYDRIGIDGRRLIDRINWILLVSEMRTTYEMSALRLHCCLHV